MAKWSCLDDSSEDSQSVAQPLQKRSRSRGWLCPSSEDEAAMPSRHSGVPCSGQAMVLPPSRHYCVRCSWQSVFSSDDEDALCPIIRQPPPSGQRPPEGSPHDDDACPIIRQATLRQTPGGSRHWAESDSDVETLTPSRHSGVPLMQCPHRAQKYQFGRGDVESMWSWCHQYSRQSVS